MFLTDKVRGWLTWQIRHHVEEVTLPLLSLGARMDDLSGQIEDVRKATVEVQRIVTDDLDAANETAALLGRALATLTASVDELRAEVTARAGGDAAAAETGASGAGRRARR